MTLITPDLVTARQSDLLAAAARSRRGPRRTAPSSFVSQLTALARAAQLRSRRDTELVPGPFAACAAC